MNRLGAQRRLWEKDPGVAWMRFRGRPNLQGAATTNNTHNPQRTEHCLLLRRVSPSAISNSTPGFDLNDTAFYDSTTMFAVALPAFASGFFSSL